MQAHSANLVATYLLAVLRLSFRQTVLQKGKSFEAVSLTQDEQLFQEWPALERQLSKLLACLCYSTDRRTDLHRSQKKQMVLERHLWLLSLSYIDFEQF